MKKIYANVNVEAAQKALENFDEKWSSKYSYASKSWKANLDELLTFYNYPLEIRKVIYTTNIIENLNRNIRKISKNKTSFPTENSLSKIVYLSIQEQTKKWTMRMKDWGIIFSQLQILFEDQF